jgi:hypothetical protein
MVQRSIRATTIRRLGRGQLNGQRSSLSRQTRSNSNRYLLDILIFKVNRCLLFKYQLKQMRAAQIQKAGVVPVRPTLH